MSTTLAIENLSVALPQGADRALALGGVSLALREREILCVVGESGSGKSMTANAIMRLLPVGVGVSGGAIRFEGRDILALPEAEMRHLRGRRIAMVFQEPMTALNPLRAIGDQIGEMFRTHTGLGRAAIDARILGLLDEVRLPDPRSVARAYPHELSGGQRQRAMIAMALALEPTVLIADEPTTALDVTTQAQILRLIRDLQRKKGTAVLFITHDFGVVGEIADRVAVMQNGQLVEEGYTADVLDRPKHSYTRMLLAAVPPLTAPPARPVSAETVLSIDRISKTYLTRGSGLRKRSTLALDQVTLALPKGSTLGIVGESGSGKSTLAKCLVRLVALDAGAIRMGELDIAHLSRREAKHATGRIQMVFQDPYGSLNPRRRAGDLVAQGPIAHGVPPAHARARVKELFALVGLDPAATERFPHEFSGGQRQRIGLARALALEPEILVADEPVSSLDVSVQAQVLELLAQLRVRLGLSMVFITHDLRVAAQICDRVAVMKDGRVVEEGLAADVFSAPQDAYTRALIDAIPQRRQPPGAAAIAQSL
ncbi:MAG: ABC transporter ATP-binding protein [Pseudomonadota bacterium]